MYDSYDPVHCYYYLDLRVHEVVSRSFPHIRPLMAALYCCVAISPTAETCAGSVVLGKL